MASFIRKVPTASGATAVQVMHKQGRQVTGIEHIGSAHDEAQLAVLLEIAEQRLRPGQGALDLEPDTAPGGGARVVGGASQLLWDVLAGAYARLGFGGVDDDTFMRLVLARIIEPTSKADTVRVLAEVGVSAPSVRTIFRSLKRCQDHDYRAVVQAACLDHVTAGGTGSAMIMYDCTTLWFEAEREDDLRKVGMSKERRVDPQILVGLLVTTTGFPLAVHCFEGNKAETKTLLPVLAAFTESHGLPVKDLVVVADAGMLSAANLNALEEAGFCFIVGSRISKAPYDLAGHFERHGTHFADRQILESARVMGTGRHARTRRVVYQYLFERQKRDQRTINAQITRAEKVADGSKPLKKDRFVKLTGATKTVNRDLEQRARALAGMSGSPDPLLGRGPLRTGRAPFRASGSSKSEGGGGGGEECWQGLGGVRSARATLPPVVGQGRVIHGCPALHFDVADDGSPRESSQVAATFVVAEHPSVVASGVESSPVASLDPPLPLVRMRTSRPAPEADPHPVVQLGVDLL